MTVVRELVTMLRYEVDGRGLRDAAKVPAPGTGPGWKQGQQSINATSNAMTRLRGVLMGVAASFGAVKLAGIADEWATIRGRIALVVDGLQAQKETLENVYAIAQKTGQSFVETTGVFLSIQRNAKDLNLDLRETETLTESIANAMSIGGGSAQAQAAALQQLGQALGAGALRGDELNSIIEQAPRLAQSIAEAFGVSVGQLKDLGKAGKLSSKELAQGLIKQSGKLRKEFESLPATFSRATTRLSNKFSRVVGELNESLGLARAFEKVTGFISDNLTTILTLFAAIAGYAVLVKISALMASIAASGGLLGILLARVGGARALGLIIGQMLRFAAILAAVYFVFDDIMTWFKGGDSMLGRIIGKADKWKFITEGLEGPMKFIKDTITDAFKVFNEWLGGWGVLLVVITGIVLAIGLIPTLIAIAVLGVLAAFNSIRENWDAIEKFFHESIDQIGKWFVEMWDKVLEKAKAIWGAIKEVAVAAVPDWVKVGARSISDIGSQAGEFFGTPSIPTRPGSSSVTTVTQAPQITINAPNSNPATVAQAARSGVERGLGASVLVPAVEVPR